MKIYDNNQYNGNILLLTMFNILQTDALDNQGKLVAIQSLSSSVTHALQSNDKISFSKNPNIVLPISIEP